MHGTLKNQISKICFENKLYLAAAVDMVMFDIRSSPHAVTGVSPFSRFFGRPMRTKLTALKGCQPTLFAFLETWRKNTVRCRVVVLLIVWMTWFILGKARPFIHKG